MPKTITTSEFLAIAKRHGVREVGLNVSYRIDGRDKVRTFDYALMLPVQWPGNPPAGPRPAALEEVIGIDPSCWFDDGYRLPVDDWEFLSNCRRFTDSAEVKGTAIERVRGYLELVQRLKADRFATTIWGAGVEPILQWAQITMQASQDPEFKRQADQALG